MTILEIAQLPNGEVILREDEDDEQPLVTIRFSEEIRDMLGDDLVGVAEAMMAAATEYIEEAPLPEDVEAAEEVAQVVH